VKPESRKPFVVRRPQIVVIALLLATAPAFAQSRKARPERRGGEAGAAREEGTARGKSGRKGQPAPPGDRPRVFDFSGLTFEGRLRTPQLLYFLDRAAEELQRASLERRSFLPELVRSIDEEPL
jgi:hypothetical protein